MPRGLKTGKICSRVDPQTHAGGTLDNHVILTFDLLISASKHTEGVPCSITLRLATLMLTEQVVFHLERGQTHKVTDVTDQ